MAATAGGAHTIALHPVAATRAAIAPTATRVRAEEILTSDARISRTIEVPSRLPLKGGLLAMLTLCSGVATGHQGFPYTLDRLQAPRGAAYGVADKGFHYTFRFWPRTRISCRLFTTVIIESATLHGRLACPAARTGSRRRGPTAPPSTSDFRPTARKKTKSREVSLTRTDSVAIA